MMSKIALCADSQCLNDPATLGLKGERILDQTWIVPFADALIARKYLREHDAAETWVVSNDTIDGINLAAALKKDNARQAVRLFLSSPSGSKMSRCQNAGVIPICGSREFAHLYTAHKLGHAQAQMKPEFRELPFSEANDARQLLEDRMIQHSTQVRDDSASPRYEAFDTREQKPQTSEEAVSPVTVRCIVHDRSGQTAPLPTIDIDEIPLITNVNAPVHSKTHDARSIPKDTASEAPFSRGTVSPVPPRKDFTPPASETPSSTVATVAATKKASAKQIVSQVKGAHIISVVSGSGGTGKSAIATMAALLAQKRGIKTLLLDADFQFGDLKYLLGYKETLEVGDILTHPEQIETLLKQDSWPALLSAPAKLEYSEVAEERIGELLAYLKPHFDLIVVNTGSFWSEFHLQLLEASNGVFFVIDQRPSSVRACNHALDLCARCGIATTSFSYLLNFCSKKSLLSTLDVSCALKGATVHEVKDGGAEVGELLGAGMAHKLSRVNNLFCSSMASLLEKTVFEYVKPSLDPSANSTREKSALPEKTKLRGRQKRRAACY